MSTSPSSSIGARIKTNELISSLYRLGLLKLLPDFLQVFSLAAVPLQLGFNVLDPRILAVAGIVERLLLVHLRVLQVGFRKRSAVVALVRLVESNALA